jgi:hypothetical protein
MNFTTQLIHFPTQIIHLSLISYDALKTGSISRCELLRIAVRTPQLAERITFRQGCTKGDCLLRDIEVHVSVTADGEHVLRRLRLPLAEFDYNAVNGGSAPNGAG